MEGYTDSIPESPRDGYRKMWEWLNETLLSFREKFTREIPFRRFVVIVLGFMTWKESVGVTSFIRELWLDPCHYEAVLHFFRSTAWGLDALRDMWVRVVANSGVIFREWGMPILVGDGTKKSKEGKRMPCVKKLFQESENSAKPAYMFGHMFGTIGVLAGGLGKLFCVPLSMRIHDGDKQIHQWADPGAVSESHVVRIIREASHVAKQLTKAILLLDRYYLSVPALTAWIKEEQRAGRPLLSIVTRAKSNARAFEKPVRKPGRGRPPVRGNEVKLRSLFATRKDEFTQATLTMYGKQETVLFLCVDLLWGEKLYQELRFVLVKLGTKTSIFVSTDLTLSPEQIIRLYSYRFKIECCFRELKQVIAGFAYHFWTSAMPKLDRYAKSGTDQLEAVTAEKDRKRITAAYNATQGFVMIACIAMGLLQIASLRFADEINASPLRWLRTRTNLIPSEASTADFMRKTIFRMFASGTPLPIIRFIRQLQHDPPDTACNPGLKRSV